MRRLRYCVATSLDGFIAGPGGEADWIAMDQSVDFEQFFKQFDTLLMGRRTFETARSGRGAIVPGMQTVVCSRMLKAAQAPGVVLEQDAAEVVRRLKGNPGLDIWLFGGGSLFRSLLDDELVDTVELAVMPVLLSQGTPLLPSGLRSTRLRLTETKALASGIVSLSYAVEYGTGRKSSDTGTA